ncbi:MAG: GNAT family N-acetyltransferase [Anaerolineae bacterium]|nr:GNAT family N-acetyltransferase [Anaerolineae bacterium]
MIVLTTPRLVVRNFTAGDWQDLQETIRNYQASEWAKYEDPWPTSDNEIKGIVSWFAQGDEFLAVSLKSEDKVIGFVAINKRTDRDEDCRNLGYVFNPEYSGKGFATEGCTACIHYVFDSLQAASIITGTHPDNEPSIRLLKRLNLREIDNGEWTITIKEWLAIQYINRAKGENPYVETK